MSPVACPAASLGYGFQAFARRHLARQMRSQLRHFGTRSIPSKGPPMQ